MAKAAPARAIHQLGRRKDGPFVQLNCAALNEALLESELFGHIKGAFTGAYRHRPGRFEAANGGDIFLDEIGDIPMSIQVKLLWVLETKEVEHVGDDRRVSTDVRTITATNKNLEELIAQKKFREDLFFRINVFPIHLAPLRERSEDIPLLVDGFIRKLQAKTAKKISGLTPAAMERFMIYGWPGNIRELRSALEFAFVIADKGLIDLDQLPPKIVRPQAPPAAAGPFLHQTAEQEHWAQAAVFSSRPGDSEEKRLLIEALRQSSGNQTQAARILGINRVTVWNRMKKYGIDLKKILTL